MERQHFIKTILGTSILITMDGFSTMAQALSKTHKEDIINEFASFDAIHLNNTNLEKSTQFWTKIVGMTLRKSAKGIAEFGTETKTLVVVYETAQTEFKKGYSGLYHFAIHAPNKEAFATMIYRLKVNNYPFTAVDHTMSQSIYLDDPDGINVEFTLETPERFKRVVTTHGLKIEDSKGNIKSASDYLNLDNVLKHLPNKTVNKPIAKDTYLGHLHLYANNVEKSNTFYQQIQFLPFNYLPQFMYADLGAGGAYKHRIALNSWHGKNRPMAPEGYAGMRHFQINFSSKEKLNAAIKNIEHYQESEAGYWVKDATGNTILLKSV